MLVTHLIDQELFSGGPARIIEDALRLLRSRFRLNIRRRAWIAVLISWPPLAVLAVIADLTTGKPSLYSFFTDAGCYARFLIAVPLLIIAEGDTVLIFGRVVRHFLSGGFIPASERVRYNDAVQSTRRLLNSKLVEITAAVLACAIPLVAISSLRHLSTPSWYWNGSTLPLGLSPAGMWHEFVSLPLLLLLCFGWLWKVALWWRIL